MRLIDADALEKEMCSGCEYNKNKYANCDDCAIANAPTIDAGWIPCSERLPVIMDWSNGECSDDVLICVADDEYITISTGFYGYYPRSTSQQGWWSMWAYGCSQLDSKYKVIAWMPLPKPYKAESEVEE